MPKRGKYLIQGWLRVPAPTSTISDAVADFSIASNPNEPWRYGYSDTLGGAFNLHSTAQPNFISGVDRWTSPAVDPSFTLSVARNRTGSPTPNQTIPPTATYPPDMLHMHPLPNRYDIVRWTAPAPGTYSFQGKFAGLDVVTSVADTDVHVLLNSTTELIPVTVLRGVGTEQVFSFTTTVATGSTIDFAVGRGPSGFHQNDSTGLKVIITLQ